MGKVLKKLARIAGVGIVAGLAVWGGVVTYNLYSCVQETKKVCRQGWLELADTNKDGVLSEDEKAKMYKYLLRVPTYEGDGHGFGIRDVHEWLKDFQPSH